MDTAAATNPAADAPAAESKPETPAPQQETPAPESALPSEDDVPSQHGITEELARLFLERFLPEDSQFSLTSYKYRPIASLGEGYTTVRKVLELTYRDERSGKEDTAVFVVKVPSGSFAGFVREMGLYEREVIMYAQVIEHFRHILSQRGKQVLLPFPRYVYGRMVKGGEVLDDRDRPLAEQTQSEALVIELLNDFEVIDKKVGLDVEHLRLVMPALARYHSVGLVLRQRHPERATRLRQIKNKFPDAFDGMDGVRTPLASILEHLGMQKEADRLAELSEMQRIKRAHKTAFDEDREGTCLVHGDLWSCNMMFRYETGSDGVRHPAEIRFVDLQMSSFGDIAYDLIYCLISSTVRATRRAHLRDMLKLYEEAFRTQLSELGEDPAEIAPWLTGEWLLSRYSEALPEYINFPLGVVQLILSTDEDQKDMLGGADFSDYMAACGRLRERWGAGGCAPMLQERVLGIVDDLREFGHI